MKKQQQQIIDFVNETFEKAGKAASQKKAKKSNKKKVNHELRLKTKIPEEDIIKQNLEKLKEYKAKNKIKSTIVDAIVKLG